MDKQIQSIIRNLQNVLSGEPWFGKPVYSLLEEVDRSKVYIKSNENSHSLADLLYHLITWAEFTLKSLERAGEEEIRAIEELDWRKIDPAVHTWEKGLAELKSIHEKIILTIKDKNDEFLSEKVEFRKYNFRILLNGLIQHDIYHAGQIAYVKKLLS